MHSYVVNYLCSLSAQTTLCYMYTVCDMILRGNIDEHFYVNHFNVSRKKYTQPPIFDFTDGITYDKTRVDRAWKFHLRPISGLEGIQK